MDAVAASLNIIWGFPILNLTLFTSLMLAQLALLHSQPLLKASFAQEPQNLISKVVCVVSVVDSVGDGFVEHLQMRQDKLV